MRVVLPSPAFDRMVGAFLKQNPSYKDKLAKTIDLLKKEAFHPSLKTHKLHGPLKKFFACSVTYDQRIVFEMDDYVIVLLAIGSHDEIY